MEIKTIKEISAIIISAFLFISTLIIALIGIFFGAGDGQLGSGMTGVGYFKAFTTDSNIVEGIFSLIVLIYLLLKVFKKHDIPRWVYVLQYIGTVAVTLTLITVVFFLAPMSASSLGVQGYLIFFSQDMFFFHFLNPILSIALFYLLSDNNMVLKDNLLALIPVVLYVIFYTFGVLVFKTLTDFYGFTFGGKYYLTPIVIIVMLSATYLFGFILRKLKDKFTA